MRLPSQEANFRRRYLNQRVSMHSPLIAASDWKACRADFEFEPGEGIYLAIDMSLTTDLTALVAVSAKNKSRVKAWAWKPEALIYDHAKRDRQPYDVWLKQGLLEPSPGRTVDPRRIARKVIELSQHYNVLGVAFDYNRFAEVQRVFNDEGMIADEDGTGGLRLRRWGQGFAGMNPAVIAFETAVLNNELVHDGHPVLTNNVMNALATEDAQGRRMMDKAASRFRIDLAVALAMALGLKAIDQPEKEPTNPWEDPNFQLMVY